MGRQLSEEICVSALDCKEQHVDKVQQRHRGEYPNIGAGAADILDAKGGIRRGESRCEDCESLVGIAEVPGHEVWEDSARSVNCGRVRLIVGVPLIFELRKGLS